MVTFQFEPQYLYLVDAFLKEIEGNIDCVYENGALVFLTNDDRISALHYYIDVKNRYSERLKAKIVWGWSCELKVNRFIMDNPKIVIVDIKLSMDSSSGWTRGEPNCLILYRGLTEKCVECNDTGKTYISDVKKQCPLCLVEKTEAKKTEVE